MTQRLTGPGPDLSPAAILGALHTMMMSASKAKRNGKRT